LAIARVSGQSASTAFGAVAPGAHAITLTNNPTAGNLVVVGIFISSTVATLTVADSASNSYTATTSSPATSSGVGGRASIFYLKNAPANASKTINITLAGATTDLNAWVQEYSGADTSASVLERDAVHTSATSSTAINDPTITTTGDGDLLFCACGAGQTISTANSPWAGVGSVGNGNYAEDMIQSAHGSQAINFTQSPAGQWCAVVAAFAAAGSTVKQRLVSLNQTRTRASYW
jgi:hypothetical protein